MMIPSTNQRVALTMGPVLFNWPVEKWSDFYAQLADEAAIDLVYLGEVVCSKRTPFYLSAMADAVGRLQRGGKTVVLSTLALITLMRERKECAELIGNGGCEIEVNDLTALVNWDKGEPFHVGPYVNVYNEGTLAFLAGLGASSVCLPPELPFQAVESLAAKSHALGIGCEIWSFGRIPLAISGRCYHARIDGLTKDACQFGCARDSDGLAVSTLNSKGFLAINGVQTLSYTYSNVITHVDRLEAAGVTALRLSPHNFNMRDVSRAFRDRLDRRIDGEEALSRLQTICGPVSFSNGFLFGEAGVEMVTSPD